MSFDTQFQDLMAKTQANPAALAAFQKDPLVALKEAHNPLVPSLQTGESKLPAPMVLTAAPSESEHIDVTLNWWGVDFKMNEKLTQDVVIGAVVNEALTAIILAGLAAANVVAAAAAAVIAAGVSIVIIEKVAEIEIANGGNGVNWLITWPQWAALVSVVPLGPPALAVEAAVVIHPLRN